MALSSRSASLFCWRAFSLISSSASRTRCLACCSACSTISRALVSASLARNRRPDHPQYERGGAFPQEGRPSHEECIHVRYSSVSRRNRVRVAARRTAAPQRAECEPNGRFALAVIGPLAASESSAGGTAGRGCPQREGDVLENSNGRCTAGMPPRASSRTASVISRCVSNCRVRPRCGERPHRDEPLSAAARQAARGPAAAEGANRNAAPHRCACAAQAPEAGEPGNYPLPAALEARVAGIGKHWLKTVCTRNHPLHGSSPVASAFTMVETPATGSCRPIAWAYHTDGRACCNGNAHGRAPPPLPFVAWRPRFPQKRLAFPLDASISRNSHHAALRIPMLRMPNRA